PHRPPRLSVRQHPWQQLDQDQDRQRGAQHPQRMVELHAAFLSRACGSAGCAATGGRNCGDMWNSTCSTTTSVVSCDFLPASVSRSQNSELMRPMTVTLLPLPTKRAVF